VLTRPVSLRAANCDFSNGLQEGPTDSGITVDITLNSTGTKHYACQIAGHCTAGNMNQQVIVTNCAAAGGFACSGLSLLCSEISA